MGRQEYIFTLMLLYSLLHPLMGQSIRRGDEELEIIEKKSLMLDEETAYPFVLGARFQFCEDISAIAYLNHLSRSIKYFDYTTGKLLEIETRFESQGPNGLGPEPEYFHYVNKDSIFVISAGTNFSLFLINRSGKLLNTFKYSSDNYERIPFPTTSRLFGVLAYVYPYIYIGVHAGHISNRNNVAPIIKLDIELNNFEYLEEPLAYQGFRVDKLPGSNQGEFYATTIAYNKKAGELMINFPIDHNVKRLRGGNVSDLITRSKLIGDFKLLPKNRSSYQHRDFRLDDVIINSARYLGVIYNPYLNVYYRIGKVEGSTELLKRALNGEKVKRPFQYVLGMYDSSFNLITEKVFRGKEAYFERGVFVSPDGLWTLQLNVLGEDIMGLVLIGLD